MTVQTRKPDAGALHQHLLDLLSAKDHADAARIIAQHHARELLAEKNGAQGEPTAWIIPDIGSGSLSGRTLTRSKRIAERHGGVPLYPYPSAAQGEPKSEMPVEFGEWFGKNYPGNTIISAPHWHAPRIWRAARYAMLAAKGKDDE